MHPGATGFTPVTHLSEQAWDSLQQRPASAARLHLWHTPWVFEVFTSTVTVEQTMLISRKWRYGIDNHSTIVAELREITTSGGTPGDGRRMARKREKDAVRGYQARCAEKSMCSGQFLSRHVQLGVPPPAKHARVGPNGPPE